MELELSLEGLLRITVPPDQCKELKEFMDQGKTDLDDCNESQVLATLLKVLLKEFPEPVMTFGLYESFALVGGTLLQVLCNLIQQN